MRSSERVYFEGEKGEIDVFTLLFYIEKEIWNTVDLLLQQNDLEEMLAFENHVLFMALSEDKRLLNMSLDEKAGGTYRGRDARSFYNSEEALS